MLGVSLLVLPVDDVIGQYLCAPADRTPSGFAQVDDG